MRRAVTAHKAPAHALAVPVDAHDDQPNAAAPSEKRISHQTQYPRVHELAHALVRHDQHGDDPQLGYAEEELVAESVAHLAVSWVGLDSSASAVPYLACWAESAAADTFERIAGLVDRLARRFEHALGADDDRQPTPAAAA